MYGFVFRFSRTYLDWLSGWMCAPLHQFHWFSLDSYYCCLETRLLELQCGCHGNVTSSDGAQSKSESRQGTSLPKRAETFTAFDSKQKISGIYTTTTNNNNNNTVTTNTTTATTITMITIIVATDATVTASTKK